MKQAFALRVGLTGGIGSGKSTVAAIFNQHGIPVIDFDQISRELTQGINDSALQHIRSQFGDHFFDADGTLSRARIREAVFQSPAQKQKLEDILHPAIRTEAERQYQDHAQNAPLVIFDMPVLAESEHWQHQLDKILVIDCEESVQIGRVMTRSGWTEAQVKAVIATQATRAQRLAIATDIIDNTNISLKELEQQVTALLQQWLP